MAAEKQPVFGRADYEEWLAGSDVFKANPGWGADAGHSAPGPCRSCGIRIAQLPRLLPRDCWACFPAHARQ